MRTFDDLRGHLLDNLNAALRRPGMYGGELVILTLFDALAFADDRQDGWHAELDELKASGAATATMVAGGVEAALGHRSEDVMASVYADIAHRNGWLVLDSDSRVPATVDVIDGELDDVVASFGKPALWCGGGNPRYPKTLGYPDPAGELVFFHFMPELRLMALRRGGGPFRDSFLFTPAGLNALRDNVN